MDHHQRLLFRYAQNGKARRVDELLMAHPTTIRGKGNDGESALHLAVLGNHTSTVKLLLERGAHINAADNNGVTCLHIASKLGNTAIVRLLLLSGADKALKSNKGKTAATVAKTSELRKLIDEFWSPNTGTSGSTIGVYEQRQALAMQEQQTRMAANAAHASPALASRTGGRQQAHAGANPASNAHYQAAPFINVQEAVYAPAFHRPDAQLAPPLPLSDPIMYGELPNEPLPPASPSGGRGSLRRRRRRDTASSRESLRDSDDFVSVLGANGGGGGLGGSGRRRRAGSVGSGSGLRRSSAGSRESTSVFSSNPLRRSGNSRESKRESSHQFEANMDMSMSATRARRRPHSTALQTVPSEPVIQSALPPSVMEAPVPRERVHAELRWVGAQVQRGTKNAAPVPAGAAPPRIAPQRDGLKAYSAENLCVCLLRNASEVVATFLKTLDVADRKALMTKMAVYLARLDPIERATVSAEDYVQASATPKVSRAASASKSVADQYQSIKAIPRRADSSPNVQSSSESIPTTETRGARGNADSSLLQSNVQLETLTSDFAAMSTQPVTLKRGRGGGAGLAARTRGGGLGRGGNRRAHALTSQLTTDEGFSASRTPSSSSAIASTPFRKRGGRRQQPAVPVSAAQLHELRESELGELMALPPDNTVDPTPQYGTLPAGLQNQLQ